MNEGFNSKIIFIVDIKFFINGALFNLIQQTLRDKLS